MRRSRGVSTFVATLVLVSISLSLSYVVYEGVSRLTPAKQLVFENQINQLPGNPSLFQVTVNASSPAQPSALVVDNSSSTLGILYFDGTRYGTTSRLCYAGATTFFSVYSGSGTLQARGNGRSWIDGYWTSSLVVQPGWHEVMFANSSSCSVVDTDGLVISSPGPNVSSVPVPGSLPSASLSFYVPSDGDRHQIILVFPEGYDEISQ